jgi:hypothetical protein
MAKTYAAEQHAPQQISIDHLEDGRLISQVSFWFISGEAAKAELQRLCQVDQVQAFSQYVVGLSDIKR